MKMIRKAIFIGCSLCCVGCCIFLAVWFVNGQLVKSRDYELSEWFHTVAEEKPAAAIQAELREQPQEDTERLKRKESMEKLQQENEDAVGWIVVDGTGIDYPVVQSVDNAYYLKHNFWRKEDRYGAIFVDCANAQIFESQHVILYGHNMKDGAMFGGLSRYLDGDYMTEFSTVQITMPDGDVVSYRIFAARKTDAYDWAYQTSFENANELEAFEMALAAPKKGEGYLTLSTCANGADGEERILVHAVRE